MRWRASHRRWADVLSSAAVQMWHDECGAQASELSAALWPESSAAGIEGTLHRMLEAGRPH